MNVIQVHIPAHFQRLFIVNNASDTYDFLIGFITRQVSAQAKRAEPPDGVGISVNGVPLGVDTPEELAKARALLAG